MPPRPSSSRISYSEASASRTMSKSVICPEAIAATGVVARRSRPQDGQNRDLPVTSLPQREQNICDEPIGPARRASSDCRLSNSALRGGKRRYIEPPGVLNRRPAAAGNLLRCNDLPQAAWNPPPGAATGTHYAKA